jgi:fibronectin type III domain
VEIPVTQYAPVQKLPAVTDLTATADGTKVDVSWTAVEHATGYEWRIAAASAPTTTVDGGTVEATSVIITGLEPTTAYIVSVMALGDNGATYDDSDEATVDVTTGESSGITPGPAWNYSFLGSTTAVFGTDKTGGTGTLGGYAWTAAYTWAAGSGYVAYESNNGLHIGSGSNAPKTITFSTSAYTEGIASVSISVRDTNTTTASLTVTVGGTPLIYNGNESVTLTSAVTKYTFEAASPLKGEIVILIDRGSTSGKKAIYVTELGIN